MEQLIPITLPPGFYKNGTPYSSLGRWADGNLVRWRHDMIVPVGGWERRTTPGGVNIDPLYSDPTVEAARNVLIWADNNGTVRTLIGTNNDLYLVNALGTIEVISPTGLVRGLKDEVLNEGYGGGYYSAGFYGVGTNNTVSTPAFTWEFDLWGEDPLASGRGVGAKLYRWEVNSPRFTSVPNTPTDFNGFVVTDHRFVMVFGALDDPRIVRWSDRENLEEWTPAATNQAGSQRLKGHGKLVTGRNIHGGVLILSETDAYFANYINPPFIYGFRRVGHNCGIANPNAVLTTSAEAIWVGHDGFFVFDGSTVRILPCDVWDYFYNDRDENSDSKISVLHTPTYSEFWWLYQSRGGTEVDSYIAFNYKSRIWTVGRLDRTTGGYNMVQGEHIMISPDGLLYTHELEGVAPVGATPYITSGPIEVAGGSHMMMVRRLLPDEYTLGSVSLTILGRDMPTAVDRTYGPYSLSNPTNVKARGRELRLKFEQVSPDWQIGPRMRLDVANIPGVSIR